MMNTSRLVDRAVLREHTRISSWRSLSVMAGIYALVALVAWLASSVLGWWFTPIAIFLIGCMQHTLFVLHHEASHLGLHPNRIVNDIIADTLLAIPVGVRLEYYRVLHMQHHRHIRDEEDPELSLLRGLEARSMPMAVIEALTGITAIRGFTWYARYVAQGRRDGTIQGSALGDLLMFAAVWLPPLALAYANGWLWGVVLYWILPLIWVYVPLIKMHSYSDHMLTPQPEGATEYDRTLTRRFGPLSTFIFNPLNAGEHLAHHLYASVPWYHLPSFVRHLERNEEYFERSQEWHSDGFFVGRSTVFGRVVMPYVRMRDRQQGRS